MWSSKPGQFRNTRVRGTVAGAVLLVVQAAGIGLAANALHPQGLPWKRIPLRESRRVADAREVLPPPPSAAAIPSAPVPPVPAVQIPAPPERPALEEKAAGPAPVAVQEPEVSPKSDTVSAAAAQPPAPTRQPETSSRPKPSSATTPAAPKPEPAAPKIEALFTMLEDARTLFERREALFVDARHRQDYEVEHIPGAESLFVEEIDDLYDRVLADIPKERTIITYCSDPECGTAVKLADALVARGHTRVFILMEGLPGWKEAGYPTKQGASR